MSPFSTNRLACFSVSTLVSVLFSSLVVTSISGPVSGQIPRSQTLRVETEAGIVVALDDKGLRFEVVPRQGEGMLALAFRICGDRTMADLIAANNGGEKKLLAGIRYQVPFSCATGSLRERGLQALFPRDQPSRDSWLHRVGGPRGTEAENLWRIALWFTGRGEAYSSIRSFNGLEDESIELGQVIRVPRELLRPVFAAMLPALQVTSSSTVRRSSGGPAASEAVSKSARSTSPLGYGQDQQGRYGSYRLRAGEALYSGVVVRFTGRLLAEDVNPLAERIARRSGITDLTDIPVGYEIKIPLEYLSLRYLPVDDPRRVEYEREESAAARYSNTVRSADLRGVTVILDAGHGGEDPGTSSRGVWESVYAYDIMERVRRELVRRTGAQVLTTTQDGPAQYQIPAQNVLPLSRKHRVMTTPPYKNVDSKTSANLRWALSNSMLSQQSKAGTEDGNVIFISIHADSLHPSVRGTMAYVPGLLPIRPNYKLSSVVYRRYREARDHGTASFSKKQRVKSLGLSRDLAEHVISAVRGRGVTIHSNQPIRDRIIRSRRPWVPAVLKYNKVPAKILVEVCNLANPEDLKLIKTQAFREKFAAALVDGFLAYYETGSSAARATAD